MTSLIANSPISAALLALALLHPGVHAQVKPGPVADAGASARKSLSAEDRAQLTDELEKLISAAIASPSSVGLSVAVALGDDFLIKGGYGIAEAEHEVPADERTVFRIGSITKQFTAAAIMRFVEQEEIVLDEPLGNFLPDFPTKGHDVNILHLLTHTSGIPSYTSLGAVWQKTIALELTHDELLEHVIKRPFDFAPGERYQYNNTGYYLLGMIIEELSGKSYADYLQAEFFDRLGLARTRYDTNSALIPHRAQGYRLLNGQLSNDGLIGMSQPGAAGALVSTAEDLIRWQLALIGGEAVDEESYAQMTTPFPLNGGSLSNYGFGLMLAPARGHKAVAHGGGINGFNSTLMHFPDAGLSVAAISNCENYRAGALGLQLAFAILQHPAFQTR